MIKVGLVVSPTDVLKGIYYCSVIFLQDLFKKKNSCGESEHE